VAPVASGPRTGSGFGPFKIGTGTSSRRTVGLMHAALLFALRLDSEALLERAARVQVSMNGSPSAIGQGYGSDQAVLFGLTDREPDTNCGRSAPAGSSVRATKVVA